MWHTVAIVKLLLAALALALAAPSLAEAQVFRGDSLSRRRPTVARPAAKPARAARPTAATPKKARKAVVKAKPAPAPAPKGEGDVIVIIEDA